jgi:hypothetical protein
MGILMLSYFQILLCLPDAFMRPYRVDGNVRALLQMGNFMIVSPVLQLGFVLLMKLRTFVWLIRRARTTVDSST